MLNFVSQTSAAATRPPRPCAARSARGAGCRRRAPRGLRSAVPAAAAPGVHSKAARLHRLALQLQEGRSPPVHLRLPARWVPVGVCPRDLRAGGCMRLGLHATQAVSWRPGRCCTMPCLAAGSNAIAESSKWRPFACNAMSVACKRRTGIRHAHSTPTQACTCERILAHLARACRPACLTLHAPAPLCSAPPSRLQMPAAPA